MAILSNVWTAEHADWLIGLRRVNTMCTNSFACLCECGQALTVRVLRLIKRKIGRCLSSIYPICIRKRRMNRRKKRGEHPSCVPCFIRAPFMSPRSWMRNTTTSYWTWRARVLCLIPRDIVHVRAIVSSQSSFTSEDVLPCSDDESSVVYKSKQVGQALTA